MATRRASDAPTTLPTLARPSGVPPRTALRNGRSQVGSNRHHPGHSRQRSSVPGVLRSPEVRSSSKLSFTASDRRIDRFEDHEQHCHGCHCHRTLSPATELNNSPDLVSPENFHPLIGEGDGAQAQSFPPLEINTTTATTTNRSDLGRASTSGHAGPVHFKAGSFDSSNHGHERSSSLDSQHLGKTVLHLAAEYGHVNVVRLLLARHVNVDLRDDMGDTALHRAAQRSQMPMVEFLVSANASLDVHNSSGRTPLQVSVIRGDASIVQLLLDQGATAL